MDALVKKAFVKQVLKEEGKRFNRNQGAAIAKLLHFHSGRLDRDRPHSVESGDVMDGRLTVSIPAYGRVLDIKPKNRKLSKNLDRMTKRGYRRRAFPIYNRFAFGHYNAIAYRLMYGLTEEVAENIKKELSQIA